MQTPSVSNPDPDATTGPSSPIAQHIGRFRWVICTVLLLGVTKNYMDRLVIGILKHTLQVDLGWSEIDYGNLVVAFTFSYAVGMVVVGRIVDWLGTRIGYAVAMVTWSLAAMAHGLLSSLTGFIVARSVLGFGEAGVFPASLKAVAEWFPKKERALAVGIFNAGTNVGAIITPPVVAWINHVWGWRVAFISLGGVGIVWLLLWLWIYKEPEDHPYCKKPELNYIKSEPIVATGHFAWSRLLGYRQTWAFAMGKFITDPIWWFYLFWIPGFLETTHHLSASRVGFLLMVIYIIADIGSIAGGWGSSRLIRAGYTTNAARKITMLVCAIIVIPIVVAPGVSNTWLAVLLIGLATGAHQGWSGNLLTLPSDMFPAKAVASVVGLGGMAGAIGGMLMAKIASYSLQWTGSYAIPFAMAGSAYLLALLVIHLFVPRLQMAQLNSEKNPG